MISSAIYLNLRLRYTDRHKIELCRIDDCHFLNIIYVFYIYDIYQNDTELENVIEIEKRALITKSYLPLLSLTTSLHVHTFALLAQAHFILHIWNKSENDIEIVTSKMIEIKKKNRFVRAAAVCSKKWTWLFFSQQPYRINSENAVNNICFYSIYDFGAMASKHKWNVTFVLINLPPSW